MESILYNKEAVPPNRLQNISAIISLLADFYELAGDKKYLEDANDLANYLMSLQEEDGSYCKDNIHYTCVIYPAKSMLELAVVEKVAGLGGDDIKSITKVLTTQLRYDLNFFSNMINAPHGWTSWKNYATYYLYMLTGNWII